MEDRGDESRPHQCERHHDRYGNELSRHRRCPAQRAECLTGEQREEQPLPRAAERGEQDNRPGGSHGLNSQRGLQRGMSSRTNCPRTAVVYHQLATSSNADSPEDGRGNCSLNVREANMVCASESDAGGEDKDC